MEIIIILAASALLLLPIRAAAWRRLRPVIAILALGFLLVPLAFVSTGEVNVRIRATLSSNLEAQGNEIHIEGVEFDGAPQDLLSLFPGNAWNRVENRLAWRVYDEGSRTVIYDQWPMAGEYRIYFEKSMWRGIAEVQIGDDIYTVDCYAPVEYGETEVLTAPGPSGTAQASRLLAYASAALVLILFCIFIPFIIKLSKAAGEDPGAVSRESWSDILRVLSAFFVIIIGASGGVFTEYGLGYPSSSGHMLLFTLSSFAIPTFLMLTGAFLLHRDESPLNTLKKRVPSVVVPLVALIAVSLLTAGNWTGGGAGALAGYLAGSLFGSYDAVPSFLTLLAALYILAPVFRPVFIRSEKAVAKYAVCVVCVLPSVTYTAFALLGVSGAPLTAAALSSHIGQFLLGAHLVTYKDQLAGKWALPIFVAAAGFALSAMTRSPVILPYGYTRPTPFAAGIETTLMCGGIFALFMTASRMLDGKLPRGIRRVIKQMSSLAIGTLMIHTILERRIPTLAIGPYMFEVNSRSIAGSLGIAAFYIIISLAVSYIIGTIPVFKRVIGLDWYNAGKRDPDA